MRRSVALLCWVLSALACTVEREVPAPTQVMLRVAAESALVETLDSVRVQLHTNVANTWQPGARGEYPAAALRWPIELPILPRSRAYVSYPWEVVVQAIDDERVIAEVRAVSRFVADEHVLLSLTLEACPQPAAVCASGDCRGPECAVCRAGRCVTAGEVDGSALPEWTPDAEATDRAPDAAALDGGRDAGTGRSDARAPQDVAIDDPRAPSDGSPPKPGDSDAQGETDASPAGEDCEAGAVRCAAADGREREVCEDGVFVSTTPCAEGEVCATGADVTPGSCTPRSPACAGAEARFVCIGAVLHACGADGAEPGETMCESERQCQLGVTLGRCPLCVPGTFHCEGRLLQRCVQDGSAFESVQECESAALCNADSKACTDRVCVPQSKSCSGNALRMCNDAGTGYLTVETCGAGLCDAANGECDVCMPEAVSCDPAGKAVRRCRADGRAWESSPCAADKPYCTGRGTCAACAEDAHCGAGLVCANGVCAECGAPSDCPGPVAPLHDECASPGCRDGKCVMLFTPGDTPCEDGTLLCSGSGMCGECTAWTPCPDGLVCYGASCVECWDNFQCAGRRCVQNRCVD